MKNYLVWILPILCTTACTRCQTMSTRTAFNLESAPLKIDSCGLTYKGHQLQMGTPLSEWEEVLGKPSRDTNLGFVWDDLGILVGDWQNGEGVVDEVYVFFLNLDSPQAEAQELTHARSWSRFTQELEENIRKDTLPPDIEIDIDAVIKKIKEDSDPRNYIYPFTVYQGCVNLHGGPVQAGMKVEEINAYRRNLPFSGPFGYVDQDIDGMNDSDVTDQTFGGDYRAFGTECKDGRLQYYELTFTASGALEYLKIGYESPSAYENRKMRERYAEEQEE